MSSIIKEIKFFILTATNEKRPDWVSLFKVLCANDTNTTPIFEVCHELNIKR